jgi:hypothetical protein
MWNPSGFYIVDRLPNDNKMNRDYFVTNIFIPLEQAIFPRGSAPHQKQLMVHLDKSVNWKVDDERNIELWINYSLQSEHGSISQQALYQNYYYCPIIYKLKSSDVDCWY